jgi:probable rRNA maturation factor
LVIFEKQVMGVSEQSLSRFVLRARRAARLSGKVNVLVTSSGSMRSLNLRFRGKNKPTDVLSFPANASPRKKGNKPPLAGEIAISADIALENAHRLQHPPALEIKVLILHGILHLAGYDHERDNGEMARKETSLRRTLNLPDALIERSQASGKPVNAPARTSRPRRARRTV